MNDKTARVLAGVFAAKAEAEAAVADLRDLGFLDDQIGIAVAGSSDHQTLATDAEAWAELRATATGMAIAAPIGSLGGLALVGIAVPGVGILSLGGFMFASLTGALWGLFFGGLAGFTAKVRMGPDDDQWYEIPLKTGDVLLVVHAREGAREAHDVMHKHNVKCFVGEDCERLAAEADALHA
ncbi:MAG TPA: hypothetical protein VMR52_00700 [Dehalococcoidia bacterium]|nr:hypothetical protein [Dehalococcoidia bacterium]